MPPTTQPSTGDLCILPRDKGQQCEIPMYCESRKIQSYKYYTTTWPMTLTELVQK
jgi:hypothetical protein